MKPRREPTRKSQTKRERLQRAVDQMSGGSRTSAYTKKTAQGTAKPGGAEHMTSGLIRKAAESTRKHQQKLDEGY